MRAALNGRLESDSSIVAVATRFVQNVQRWLLYTSDKPVPRASDCSEFVSHSEAGALAFELFDDQGDEIAGAEVPIAVLFFEPRHDDVRFAFVYFCF